MPAEPPARVYLLVSLSFSLMPTSLMVILSLTVKDKY
jgi:hypothetical protein